MQTGRGLQEEVTLKSYFAPERSAELFFSYQFWGYILDVIANFSIPGVPPTMYCLRGKFHRAWFNWGM